MSFNSKPAMVTIIPTATITIIQNLALPAVDLLIKSPSMARDVYDSESGIISFPLTISDEDNGINAPKNPKKAAINAPSSDSINISMPR